MKLVRSIGYLIAAGALPVVGSQAQAPRFLVVPSDTTQPLIVVDTSRLTSLRQRVALSVDGVPAADALRSLMRASRLDFVFENRVVANARPVALGRDSLTVASALIRLLDGAGVDVLMRSPTTLVLMPAVTQVTVPVQSGPSIRRERIQGTVTDTTGKPLTGATVIATMAPNREVFRTTSDSAGRFELEVAEGTGDYLVYVAAVGRRAYRKRVTRAAAESNLIVNAALAPEVAQLAQVNVRGARPVPRRDPEQPIEGGGDRVLDGIDGVTPPDLSGDLTALASTLPAFGLALISGGQNNFSYGGLLLQGAEVPRDLPMTVRVSTSPFDPAQGWFSGGMVSVSPRRNPTFYTMTGRVTSTATTAPSGSSPGRGMNVGFGAFGPIDYDRRWQYATAVQAGRTYAPATTIFGASREILAEAGFARDSITALQGALAAKSLPLGGPGGRYTDAGSFLLDVSRNFISDSGAVFGATLSGNASRTRGLGLSARATPSAAGEASSSGAMLQGFLSKYFGRYHLLDLRSGVSASRSASNPAIEMPAARVLIQSDLGGGVMDAAQAIVGGGDFDALNLERARWQSTGEFSFAANRDVRHALKMRADIVVDGARRSTEDFGAFTFPSLDALRTDAPDSYTRRIESGPSSTGVWNGAISLRDLFSVSRTFSLTYGARVDVAGFMTAPPTYSTADQHLGVRTGYIPGTIHVSPRLGFSKRLFIPPSFLRSSDIGSFWNVSSFLRGGIGEFRGMTTSETLLDAIAASHGGMTLTCIGTAAPIPSWSAYAADPGAIPSQCVTGAPASFTDAAPTIHAFASSYAPPRSWKANLSYRRRGSSYALSIDGNVALNLDQPGTLDRNLAATPAFTTADGRWVYSPESAIVATSGAVSRSAGRIDPTLGSVLEHRSDLRSTLRAVTFELVPLRDGFSRPLQLSYTLSQLDGDVRGLNGTAFGAVDLVERARGAEDVRHSFQLLFGIPMPEGVAVTGAARLLSGRPYTPRVATDVNGDGFANDRAFIDEAAPGFDALLAQLPGRARDCLQSQRGHAASHNSCSGPWTATLDSRIRINRPELERRRVRSIDVNVTNVLSGLDGLVNGAKFRGWGEAGIVDPVLFYVRGFDASSQRFILETNPAFGRTRSLSRVTNPFRVTLEVRIAMSASTTIQRFRWILRGRNGWPGRPLTHDELTTRFAARVADPYEPMYALADSMLLSRQQVDSLHKLQLAFKKRIAPLWSDLADYVGSLPESFDENALYDHQQEIVMRGWVLAWRTVHEELALLLTPAQRTMLPSFWTGPIYRAAAPNPAWLTMR